MQSSIAPGTTVHVQGLLLRPTTLEDAGRLAEAYTHNRDHLAPWDPVRPEAFYTEAGQAENLAGAARQWELGLVDPWLLLDGDRVVGRMNLNNIVRGVFASSSVGYWVDRDHLRRGLAATLVEHAVVRAREIGLHRLEAGTMTANTGSQAVLRAAGFSQFGTAEKYLFIAGAWQDHHLFQRILHDQPVG
ncbi:GNAT family N-acetyltransferase [Nocardioides bruguierae]|uniref:GNAT family N-acetyltransferase n=1 Tax=Nocardioides bruguierae TaxID=2945102 RepID=A0A9X2D5M0_9ACTN|nr:GNAT family protein [Nocardioides bruguierae]MCM0619444.1 GNAT family N-acetyltransferase [Nocardioides bruguierae]